jgi:hypothetical protein
MFLTSNAELKVKTFTGIFVTKFLKKVTSITEWVEKLSRFIKKKFRLVAVILFRNVFMFAVTRLF